MFGQLGKKILRQLNSLDEGDLGHESVMMKSLGAYFKRYSLSDILPYGSYDESRGLFINRSTTGFVLETLPLVGCTETIQNQLSAIFQYMLPENSNLQLLLYADPYIGDFLDHWVAPRLNKSPLIRSTATARRKFLSRFVLNGYSGTTVRRFRCIVSFTKPFEEHDDVDTVLEVKERLIETLVSAGMPTESLSPEDLMTFVDDLTGMNLEDQDYCSSRLEWNPNQDISSQIPSSGRSLQVKKNGLYLDEGRMIMKSYGVRRYPRIWVQSMISELLGNQFHNMMRIPCPFMIHYGVHIPKQEPLKMKFFAKSNHVDRQAASPLAKYLPDVLEEAEENQYVRHEIAQNHRFVKTHFSVMTISPKENTIRVDQVLKNIYRSKGWDIYEDNYLHLQGLINLLPMSWGDDMMVDLTSCKKLKTTLSTESANIMPVQGDWLGTKSPGLLLVSRLGQVFTFSPFDNDEGNFNINFIGKPGSGKSVLMQELLVSMVGIGCRVFVIDIGRSFEKTCLFLEGQHIEFTPSRPICLNPFSNIADEGADDILAMITLVVCTMAAPTEGTTDPQTAIIGDAVLHVWREKKQETTITDISQYLLSQKDHESVMLGKMLMPYTKDGLYSRFFEGKSNVDFTSNLVVIEMDELKERKDLREVITQMVIIQVTNQIILGNRKDKFMLMIDEASENLSGKKSGPFIETLARRFRKCNAALVVGTQSVNDFYNSPGALAAYENSDWLCLLSQKSETISLLRENKRVTMTPHMEEILRSVHTKQGEYAEAMICGNHGFAVGRLLLDPFSRILYSTKADEYVAVKELMTSGVSLTEAVESVARKKFPKEMETL